MQADRTNPLALTSAKNPLIKDVRRAASKGALTDDGFALAEGFHLLEEAVRSGRELKAVIASESAASRVQALPGARVLVVSNLVFDDLATTESSQGVLTLVRPPEWGIDDVYGDLMLILDGIQEPGNAGAMVRAAEAFGATVLALKGTVNLWNPKALRASAGSMFRLPCMTGVEPEEAATILRDREITAYAAMPDAGRSAAEVDLRSRVAFVAGSEGRGIQSALGPAVRIPTRAVESLNVAVAAGILLYEARRQRDL